ncbi:MAG: ATP-binding protein [Bacteroidetes bacterium]|nr:ATP-binding protein [Bacteroidota bacterium]
MIRKIAITGPESTGKSALAALLADHYQTVWVPEYAREYLDKKGPDYQLKDILQIAKSQLASEKNMAIKANGWLFCDTELIVTKIWAEYVYKTCPSWIEQQLEKQDHDLYLLCDIDIPWEPDPLREHPGLRQFFFDWFYKELKTRNKPFEVVSGLGIERVSNAIKLITQRFH